MLLPTQLDSSTIGGIKGGSAVEVASAVDVSSPAVDVDLGSESDPLLLPLPTEGEKRASTKPVGRRPRPEYIRDVRRYFSAAWQRESGEDFPWTPLARENLYNLLRIWTAWELMALWDLYLEESRKIYSVFFMGKEAPRLAMDSRFKPLAAKHEETLAGLKYGGFKSAAEVLRGLNLLAG